MKHPRANFSTILIANRGEIACRVIRTARKLGYRTVAIFSDADRAALHVKLADQAVAIGGNTPAESYLSIKKVIDACKRSGADAVHPGYGFLSENAELAQACQDHGLTFIGPPAQAINAMGNKSRSKELMLAAGVPCIPGYQGSQQSPEFLLAKAKEIGFPLMVKAAAGGGGRGLRLAHSIEQVPELLQSAKAEAEKAFGSGELLLERALIDARHVEVQVFGDQLGNVVHLGERDCSIQRRHQKVFEESPSPAVGDDLRRRMGASAVLAAKAIDYVGAGTVEFLLDKDGKYYFLEMNTRLQVEHPVTEMITGFDLVEWQLDVAAGKPLPVSQEQIKFTGHAIEARLYAEDPVNDFRPQVGTVICWRPAAADFARTDHGLNQSDEISPYYDSMIAKVITHGADRNEATRLLDRALCDTTLLGLITNREFLIQCLRHEQFRNAQTDTGFIARTWNSTAHKTFKPDVSVVCAAAAAMLRPNYGELSAWSSSGQMNTLLKLEINESTTVNAQVQFLGANAWRFVIDGGSTEVSLLSDNNEDGWRRLHLSIDGINRNARCITHAGDVHIAMDQSTYHVSNVTLRPRRIDSQASSGDIHSPTNGLLASVEVTVGQYVEKGARMCVVEAMKLLQSVCAPISGYVTEVLVEAGKQVKAKQLLIRMEETLPASNTNSEIGNSSKKENATLVEV
jgi:geranyl-CoA carboxylase alpha subunit